ncbi:MAG: tetratricopeptide repeat protein [Chloroflexi bacterium]|nr:tetratricopeptide repeat protein [Chloroflexota bacterium]
MPDFGELLTSHIDRSGFSDSDLARRVGVSRATLIRWKEGLTARPRYREDVLRCAELLRLTPEERDELLIAADFEPEALPPEALLAEPAPRITPVSPAEPDPPPAPTRKRLRLWVAVTAAMVAVAAGVVVGLALVDFSGEPDHPVAPTGEAPVNVAGERDLPAAEAGEALIVIAPFANYTAGQLEFNIRGRLRDSINREIAAAGLAGIRTDDWVETVPGHGAALSAAEQSGAAIVIWGEYDSGRVLANVTSTPTQNESLGPQVVEIATSPSGLPTAINIDLTAEVRSVALLTLSQVYLQRGEYEPAKTVLYQALERPPADPAALANLRYRLGQAYLGGEYADLDEAIWRFTEVLSVQPRSADTYGIRGLAYLERGRPGDENLAIADLTRASELAPHLATPYFNRVAAYIARDRAGDLNRALDDLERAIDAGVEGPGVYVNRAAVYLERQHEGDLDLAFEDLENAIEIDPDLAVAWVNRGNARLQRDHDGDFQQAIADFTKAIDLAPNNALGYYNRALAHSEAGNWDLSNSDLRAAHERDPRNPEINNALCWQLGVQRRHEEALPFCDLALQREPDGPGRDSRGLVHAVMGSADEAVADFRVFLSWVDASEKPTCRPHYRPSRESWIGALESGGNPFDDETLRELRLRPASQWDDPC